MRNVGFLVQMSAKGVSQTHRENGSCLTNAFFSPFFHFWRITKRVIPIAKVLVETSFLLIAERVGLNALRFG